MDAARAILLCRVNVDHNDDLPGGRGLGGGVVGARVRRRISRENFVWFDGFKFDLVHRVVGARGSVVCEEESQGLRIAVGVEEHDRDGRAADERREKDEHE